MSTPRRNILRPPRSNGVADQQRARRRQLQASLEKAMVALTRWQRRLRRAFNVVERQQRPFTRA